MQSEGKSRVSSRSVRNQRLLIFLQILVGTTASIPFLAVRIAYACLTTFSGDPTNPKWSPLFGSVAALVVMHSLMEYVVVVMYLTLGWLVPPIGKTLRELSSTEEIKTDELR
jgi:hypothetical protein